MQRFRYTLLAVCLVLLFLGVHDLLLMMRNPEPAVVSIAALEAGDVPREWLNIEGGVWDLREAISTSGSIEIEAYLVPLRSSADPQAPIHVMVETRDPAVIKLMTEYTFSFDTDRERQAFVEANLDKFVGRHDVAGMEIGGLIASGNRDKLLTLARNLKMPVEENVIFVSEGKVPGKISGVFFTLMAILGLGKVILMIRKKAPAAAAQENQG